MPINPALHTQLEPMLTPVESAGQLTAAQLPEKNGLDCVAAMLPLKPASQAQSPAGTFVPVESAGQLTATQLPEKNGLDCVAVMLPLYPASQAQSPAGTLVPVESAGQPIAVQDVPEKLPPLHVHIPPPLYPASQVIATTSPSLPVIDPVAATSEFATSVAVHTEISQAPVATNPAFRALASETKTIDRGCPAVPCWIGGTDEPDKASVLVRPLHVPLGLVVDALSKSPRAQTP